MYLTNFASSGNPNGAGLPEWKKMDKNNDKALCFTLEKTDMGKASYVKLAKNMLTKGGPKA